MIKTLSTVSTLLLSLTLLSSCELQSDKKHYRDNKTDNSVTPAIGAVPRRSELEQNWDDRTRMNFWFTSQGSHIIPYNWFTWLELADSQELFRSARHMESLRYLPYTASERNPSGLPIGFAIDKDKAGDKAWMGFTCAACHTNQIDYQGHKILVEGAPTLANFVAFFDELVASLNQTHSDEAKFERFARKVLGNQYSENTAESLRQQLLELAIATAERRDVNALPADYPKDFTSYARLDAFGNIQNEGTAFALGDLTNSNPPSAPVSYPFLWGTHQSDVVQWNASAPNTPVVGPLARNIGEVVGVFGGLKIRSVDAGHGAFGQGIKYTSSVDMIGLGHLESWVKTLRSPQWPEQYLPAINAEKAAAGEILYQQNCSSCHQVISRDREGDNYKASRVPVALVGTDPLMAINAAQHMARTLQLKGKKQLILAGDKFEETAAAITIAVNGASGIALEEPDVALDAGLIPYEQDDDASTLTRTPFEQHFANHLQQVAANRQEDVINGSAISKASGQPQLTGLVYKARPLNGIWATAPYLHNGSVPSLWQLLQKPGDRVASFWVGNREFDPVNVGYVSNSGLSEFRVLNAAGEVQSGNANSGHVFGTDLSDEDKWSLVEYLKTL